MQTTFAVAIPTYDRCETALLAALSALRQTRPPEHVLVLCDGCTDGTAAAIGGLGDPRVVALELPKASGYAYGHRNRALELTSADVILWLGDDDLLLPDHLERLGACWDRGTVDLVTSPAVIVHPDDTLEWIGADWSVSAARATLERENTNVMASVSVRAQLVRDVGGWDADQQRAGDWDLWKRVLAAGARAADTGEPTVLHFRATGRDQPWPDRVIQNTRWLERISDPSQLTDLRGAFRRARAEREATLVRAVAAFQARALSVEGSRWWRLGEKLRPIWTAMRGN
jgi:GT2 family glycosyltransferase